MNEATCETCRHMATFYTIGNCWLCAHSWPAAIRVEPGRPACQHYEQREAKSDV
jgi:hypothetical protein